MKIFWSWQSDTTGKIGRHFIRDAINAAIEKLQEAEDVEEPRERELKSALHLDQDRQGVPGSPDLAATIFKKIQETAVFIADVTPIAESAEKEDNGKKFKKKVMNPNVAIELGYALSELGDTAVLMVMNTYYGQREDLPFDLAHKAGPLLFHLSPEANKVEREAQASHLCGQFIQYLRPYLKTQPVIRQQETLAERVNKQKQEMALEQSRKDFLNSAAGVQAALKEVDDLFKTFLEKGPDVLGVEVKAKRVHGNTLCVFCQNIGMSIEWEYHAANTLDRAELELVLWRGWPPHVGMMFEEPKRLSSMKYTFDRGGNGIVGWRTGLGNPPLLSTEKMAEECIKFLWDRIHQESMSKSRTTF